MAKIKFTAFMADARGSVAGTVFSRNGSGAYTRTKVTPVNPQSTAQMTVRTRFGGRSQAWRGLTQAQRDAWIAAAVNFTKSNVFGDQVKLSGLALYKSLNQNLLNAGQSVIADAPLPASVFGFTTLSATAVNTASVSTLTFTDAIPAGTSVLVFATPSVSAGKNFVKSEYRQIAVLTSADASPATISTAYDAKFGAVGAAGSKIFFKLKPVNDTTGQAGTELSASAIVTA